METLTTTKRAVSVEEAAVQIGISRTLAYALVGQGKIRSIRAGNRILIPISALEEFLGEMAPGSTQANYQA